MKHGACKKVVSVSIPSDLIEIMDELGDWHNRSAIIVQALEAYIRLKEPTMWKILQMRRESND